MLCKIPLLYVKAHPDRSFHNFKASKSVDQGILCTRCAHRLTNFEAQKIVNFFGWDILLSLNGDMLFTSF